jgi:gamma-glutamyltranspeptidase
MYRKALGKTLRAVADNGPDAFYQGDIATNLVKDMSDFGAIITEEDLMNYR